MDDYITLSDQFDHPQGKLRYYDTYDTDLYLTTLNQKHTDIRSFNNAPILIERKMLNLDQTLIEDLNELTMEGLESGFAHISGESWTEGIAGRMADRNNWYGLSLSCAPGITTTQSVIPLLSTSEVEVVDLLTEFDDNDFLSIALPEFPLNDINTTQSWIDITSHAAGDFTSGPTVSLRLSDSIIPLVDGDSEYRRLRSSLTDINIQHVTGVRFRIEANTSCEFRASAMRLLNKDWSYTRLDLDTRLEVLKPTVAPNGSLTRAYDSDFPILFRSGRPAGFSNPEPIDTSVSTAFYTGTKNFFNKISLYFREGPGDFTQQIDLNGKSMDELNGSPQPNISTISFRSRTQREMDAEGNFSGMEQVDIERVEDPLIASYLSATVGWDMTKSTISLIDSEGNGHVFNDTGALAANTEHIFIVDLIGKTMRGRIYPLDLSGNIVADQIVFDTTIIRDDFAFVRRAGRFGWVAELNDGDAYIDNISTRRQVFAELQTASYESFTPVTGAELHVAGSSPLEFFRQLDIAEFPSPVITIDRDRSRTTTDASWRINNPGTLAPQGIQTNLIDFYDFNEIEISFDLYYPRKVLESGVGLEAFLSNRAGRIIPIPLGKIIPDRWQTFTLSPGGNTAQTGRYSFYIIQNTIGLPSVWWIDNIHVREQTLSFYARSAPADPWGDTNADWVPFTNHINKSSTGVQFIERGRNLQILGQGHRQLSYIDNIKIIPKYAQLGNFVWEENELYNPQNPTSVFIATDTGLTVVFNGLDSTDPDGSIINYRWNFGDGKTAIGPIVSYTYQRPGTYTPSLIVMDENGLQNSSEQTIFVTNV